MYYYQLLSRQGFFLLWSIQRLLPSGTFPTLMWSDASCLGLLQHSPFFLPRPHSTIGRRLERFNMGERYLSELFLSQNLSSSLQCNSMARTSGRSDGGGGGGGGGSRGGKREREGKSKSRSRKKELSWKYPQVKFKLHIFGRYPHVAQIYIPRQSKMNLSYIFQSKKCLFHQHFPRWNIWSLTQTERDNERRRRKSVKHQDIPQQQQGYLDLDMMMLDGGGGLYHEQYDEHGVLIERPDI